VVEHGQSRNALSVSRGTEGSNPSPSSSESIANLISVIGSFTADLSCSHFAVMADKDVELDFFARPEPERMPQLMVQCYPIALNIHG